MENTPANNRYKKSPKGVRAKKRDNQKYQAKPQVKTAKAASMRLYRQKIKTLSCTYTAITGTDDYYAVLEMAALQKMSTANLLREAIKLYLDYINNRRLI